MAFEHSQKGNALDPATAAELREAMTRSLSSGNHGEELKALLQRAAGDARQRGVNPEHLLMALKDIWHSLPNPSPQTSRTLERPLLQQLITRCIDEYYSR